MTRARALKTVIRARAAKTGERYTTARRHVLKALEHRTGSALRIDIPPLDTKAKTAAPPVAAKGAVSDARTRERTGHDLAHWYDVLDRFGAAQKGHTAAARHLNEVHHVDGWYAQGITVSYERARGLRTLNQRADGKYEVSISKVVAADVKAAIAALVEPRRRSRWIGGVEPALIKALAAALRAPGSKGFIVKADGLASYRYTWDGTKVEFYVTPKGEGRASVVVANGSLASPGMIEQRRSQWRTALNALAEYLAERSRA